MDSLSRRLLTIITLLLAAGFAHADAGNGLKYRADWYTGVCTNFTFGSASEALQCVASARTADWHAAPELAGCVIEAGATGEPGGTDGTSWTGDLNYTGVHPCAAAPGGSCESCGYLAHWADHPGLYRTACVAGDDAPGGPCAPPEPEECDMSACPVGTRLTDTGGAASVCDTDCHCSLELTSSTNGVNSYHNTGQSCAGGEDEAPDDLTDEEMCTAVGDGSYCASPTGDGSCGYMNDKYVCLQRVRPDECVVDSGGGRLCGPSAATTPPVPDNGTPGVPAEPDGTVEQTTPTAGGGSSTTTYNYYGPGTVAGSDRDPGTTGAGPSSGEGTSPGEPPSEAEVAGVVGGPPTLPGTEHDFSSLDNNLIGLSTDCPEPPSVTVFGHDIELSAITWFCELAGMISGLVMAAAWISALLIIGRGF